MIETLRDGTPGDAGNSGEPTPLTEQAKQQTQQVVEKAREVAAEVAGKAREQVTNRMQTGKEHVVERIHGVAQAVRLTSEQLREQHQEWLSPYAESAADTIERFAGAIEQKDFDQHVRDLERLARQQPALFVLGAFALGFAVSRLLKSTSPNGNGSHYPAPVTPSMGETMPAATRWDMPAPAPEGMTSASTLPLPEHTNAWEAQATRGPAEADDEEESADEWETAGSRRE